ncbi:hypothetical protein C8Q74DRAFT_493550 [Fomes fomentarius]|nr:hypothetical protein C8Q74DRAFT_493550 [Fomes fomentarius]
MSADSGRRPHAPPPPQPSPPSPLSLRPSTSPRTSSTQGPASTMSPRSSQDNRMNKLPPWLRCALGDMYRDFPDVRVLVRKGAPPLHAQGPGTWEVQCQACGDAGNTMIIPAGPSETLHHLIEHLREVHDNLAKASRRPRRRRLSSPESSISERTRAGPRSSQSQIQLRPRVLSSSASTSNSPGLRSTAHAVVQFLEEQGLSADSAHVLRAIGICDEKRIRHLGRLSSPALDRLENALAERGLDFAACLLVREGLCKRGGMDSGFDSPGLRPSTSHPVVQFLEEQGLSADSADALQAVGICDEKRMECLGCLPSHALDRLEKALAERGLDFAACVLVREGLCKRGRA